MPSWAHWTVFIAAVIFLLIVVISVLSDTRVNL